MAETSGFFDAEELVDGTYDREYVAEQWANYFKLFIGNGVFASPVDQLKVMATSGMYVKVLTGWAWINGYWYHNTSDLTLEVPVNTTSAPITHGIFVQFNSATREITVTVGLNRTTPNRIAPYYELKIAEIQLATGVTAITDGMITDTRPNNSVCGFVTGLIDVIDTEDLFAQYQYLFNQFLTSSTEDFEALMEQIEDAAEGVDAKALIAEGVSLGTQNGVPVGPDSPYYHNNAKYYKEQAQAIVGPQSLISLEDTDIDTETLQNGQILKYNETTEKWENETPETPTSSLSALTDTSINNPGSNQVLTFNPTTNKWENGKTLPFNLGTESGSYGYYNANNQFVAFKSQADIDAAVAAAMVGDATAADVLATKTFTNSTTSGVTGTMTNRGAVNQTLTTSTTSYTVPQGYHNGSGTVKIVTETKTETAGTSNKTITPTSGKVLSSVTIQPTPSQSKSTTSSRSAQTITPDSGKLLSSVSIAKYPDASGTYTATSRSSALDMGATNNLRYVDTTGVPSADLTGDLYNGHLKCESYQQYYAITVKLTNANGLQIDIPTGSKYIIAMPVTSAVMDITDGNIVRTEGGVLLTHTFIYSGNRTGFIARLTSGTFRIVLRTSAGPASTGYQIAILK